MSIFQEPTKDEIEIRYPHRKTRQWFKAVVSRQFDVIYDFLFNGFDINTKAAPDIREPEINGGTALMAVAYYNRSDMVEFLLDRGADVNAVNNDGYTALMFAARIGSIAAARILLNKGADPYMKNFIHSTALDIAESRNNERTAALIRSYMTDRVSESTDIDTFKRLKRMIKSNKVMELLVDRSSFKSGPSDGGCRVVARALSRIVPDSKIVTMMGKRTDGQWQAEHYGIKMPDGSIFDSDGLARNETVWQSTFKRLEQFDRETKVVDGEMEADDIPLDQNTENELVKTLSPAVNIQESVFISPNEKDIEKRRRNITWQQAVYNLDYDKMTELLNNGQNINLGFHETDMNFGETALIHAVSTHNFSIIFFLLKRGADPYKTDDHGKNAFDWAYPSEFMNKYIKDHMTQPEKIYESVNEGDIIFENLMKIHENKEKTHV